MIGKSIFAKRRVMFLLAVFAAVVIGVTGGFLYINRHVFIGPHKYTGNIYGNVNKKTERTFVVGKQQMTAKIAAIASSSVKQESIAIYANGKKSQGPIFQRNFYADGFRGKTLVYDVASDSGAIQQSGSLGNIGCGPMCVMPWTNFYVWNAQQNAFVIDNSNVSHMAYFEQLLSSYQAMDKAGCSLVEGELVADQATLSFSQLYAKYPDLNWYCSMSQGFLPVNVVFFLQAEKAIEQILDGKNIGSNDISMTLLK